MEQRYIGSLVVYQRGSLIAQPAAGIVGESAWFYIEAKIVFSQTGGAVELRVNGIPLINETGLNTCATGNEQVSQIRLYSNSDYAFFDDLYLCDTNGTKNNNFLGIGSFCPNDEPQLTDTTDYNESSTVGNGCGYCWCSESATPAVGFGCGVHGRVAAPVPDRWRLPASGLYHLVTDLT